jgi:hypothetical protein
MTGTGVCRAGAETLTQGLCSPAFATGLLAAFDHPLAVVEHDAAPTVTFIWVPALGPRR